MQSEQIRNAIISVLTSHYRQYRKHDACRRRWERETGKSWHKRECNSELYKDIVVCDFHQPFVSRTVLWVESGAAMFGSPVEFDWALDELIREQIVARLDFYPHIVTGGVYAYTDFQNVSVGDIYLNVPLLRQASKYSVDLATTLKQPKRVKRFGRLCKWF